MKRRQTLFVLMAVLTWAAAASRGDEGLYFEIRMKGSLIGYAAVQSEPTQWNGQELQRLKSATLLKFAMLGKERRMLLESETLVRPETDAPLAYTLTSRIGEAASRVECEFADHKARRWTCLENESKGDPTETTLPEKWAVLGDNNFAHWGLLMKAVAAGEREGKAEIAVFHPDAGRLETLQFVRGAAEPVEIRGATRTCTVWRLEAGSIKVFVDARTKDFLRMEVPDQEVTVALADAGVAKLVAETLAQEVLDKHFVQADVAFDDFLKVEFLEAEVDVQVIGSGVENDVRVLTTAMQAFEGRKQGARVAGRLVVRAKSYDGRDAPPFPYDGPDKEELTEWLRPSACMESDHPSVVAKSEELTRGAKDTWDAALRVSKWVEKEIRYELADTPSARLALEKRVGDCGPHSSLTVAMLRAAGIPAKLVGGLLYTPMLGGSFGQHAWVEVYMGPHGWTPLDPTTGELQRINATHIKLFEGLGGVLPKSVKVLAFQPPNRAVAAVTAKSKPLPWKLGKSYTFRYSQAGNSLGAETFTMTKVVHAGQDACEMKSVLKLTLGGAAVQGTTTLVASPSGQPLTFDRELDAAGKKALIQCKFAKGAVQVKISGSVNLAREINLPEDAYCFDNNLMGSFALICSQLDYQAGEETTVRTFHPSSLQLIPLTLKTGQRKPVQIGGKTLSCYECEVAPIKNTFWVSEDGRFVKAQQGNLVIELADAD